MAYRGQLHASEAKPKRSLEPAAAKAMSLGEGRLWQVTTGRDTWLHSTALHYQTAN